MPITKITNDVENGQKIPEEWDNGTIAYIYENKGDYDERGNYRPIFLTQIIYEIWTGLITRNLAKIMNIAARNNQFGYKDGISTIGAIVKIEQYVGHAITGAELLLMCLPKAYGAVARTLLRTTICKKGLPGEMIKRIRRWRQGENAHRNTKERMGNPPRKT